MELSKLFRRPRRYVTASLLCALSGFSFGIETSIIGPVTVMEDFRRAIGGSSQPTVQGLIVSSLILASAISSLAAGWLSDTVGRVYGICIGTFIFSIGAALQGASVNLSMFIAGRVVEGIGEGLYVGPMIVYICEISSSKHRAALTTAPQLLHTVGLVVGFFTCYGTASITSSLSWRLPFIILAVYSLLFTAMALTVLPRSPRWLTLQGRLDEAAAVWDYLEVDSADREKIMSALGDGGGVTTPDELKGSIPENSGQSGDGSNVPTGKPGQSKPAPQQTTIKDVFASPQTRPQLLFALFLMGMQQLSGIDGVLFYAPLLFQQAGLSSEQSSFLASGVSGIIIFAVTVPATIWADGWGRRPSVIAGGVAMAVLMFLMGGLYAGGTVHSDGGAAGNWVVIVTIYIYVVIYCVTWAIHVKVYAAEIQPKRTRATATGLAYFSYSLSNFAVALITPILIATTVYGAYFLFGACLLLTSIVCWLFMPETRRRNLDELEDTFRTGSRFRGWNKREKEEKGQKGEKGQKVEKTQPQRPSLTRRVTTSRRLV
ncbi:general substrate transporter [Xylariomycetidae sp. FL2044]|nr:general substrate transporter [Xylariomycetidae sp. FL2044]